LWETQQTNGQVRRRPLNYVSFATWCATDHNEPAARS
jgi:hypothetical protein